MKLSKLIKANHYEVENWMEEELKLSDYQKQLLRLNEVVRFSPFEFYKDSNKPQTSVLWRLTLPIFPIYLLLLVIVSILKWTFIGKWGFSQGFFDNFHAPWTRKLGL